MANKPKTTDNTSSETGKNLLGSAIRHAFSSTFRFLGSLPKKIDHGVRIAAAATWKWLCSLPGNIKRWAIRWYSFNKQKIPMIFIVIAGIIFTAFLDFTIDRDVNDLPEIVFQSHITAIRQFVSSPLANMTGFLLFGIYLIAIIQMFNVFTFAKKQSPKSLGLITFLTVVQLVFVSLYTYAFFAEKEYNPGYVIDEIAVRSYSIMIAGAAFLLVGTVFAWFYVDWHYVKEIED